MILYLDIEDRVVARAKANLILGELAQVATAPIKPGNDGKEDDGGEARGSEGVIRAFLWGRREDSMIEWVLQMSGIIKAADDMEDGDGGRDSSGPREGLQQPSAPAIQQQQQQLVGDGIIVLDLKRKHAYRDPAAAAKETGISLSAEYAAAMLASFQTGTLHEVLFQV